MSNYCSECGFKIDKQYKFCPNCGLEINYLNPQRSFPEALDSDSVIVCGVCGETNSAAVYSCSVCGAKLKTDFSSSEIGKSKTDKKEKIKKQKGNRKIVKEKTQEVNSKKLDNKKTLLIFTAVLISVLILLAVTGKFDSGFNSDVSRLNQTTSDSGVDLSNLSTINELEEKIKSAPGDKISIIKLANLLQDSGMFDRAVLYYKQYIELEPSDANARVDLGICYFNLNDYQSAIKNMEEALKYQPDHQLAHLNLGIVNLSAGDLTKSREWLSKAVEIDPNSDAGKRAQELLQSH